MNEGESARAPIPDLVVEAEHVDKWFGSLHVLRDVSLAVRAGEVVVLIGPSGSGKSTLLRCCNGLESIDGGTLHINQRPMGYRERDGKRVSVPERAVANQRRDVGMVFQHFNLFPHMTALANVMSGPVHVSRMDKAEARERAETLLERVGLAEKAGSYPSALSGGQQQRVAIARALAMQPSLMLFDEATSALDPEVIGEVLDVMQELARGGMTMVVVTHEMGFAREVGDRVVMLDDGAVVEEGRAAQIFEEPAHERTRLFLSKIIGHTTGR